MYKPQLIKLYIDKVTLNEDSDNIVGHCGIRLVSIVIRPDISVSVVHAW